MRALFRLTGASMHDPEVEQWLADCPGELGNLARHWFSELRACGADTEVILHDGQPTVCVQGAALAYVDAFSKHVNLGFFQGAELPDPHTLLEGTGKHMRHVKLKPDSNIDTEALLSLISAAYDDLKSRLAAT